MKKKEKIRVYIASYCQNEYQRERVAAFVKKNLGEIVNPDFSKRNKNSKYNRNSYLAFTDCTEPIMSQAEQVWVILCRNIGFDRGRIIQREQLAQKLRIPIRYFRINNSGQYVGRAHEFKRGEY